MIGQDSAEGSFNLISTSKELLHPDLLWNKAQRMIVSLKRIFDTMCMYPTKTKLPGQRKDANLTALTCNGVRWWWRLIGVEMMDPFFCSQSLMLSLVTSVHIYNISKCKDYAAKRSTSHCFVNGREVLTLSIHTGISGCKVPALANLLVQGGRISLYIPPFGSVWLQYNMSYGFIQTIS